MTPKARGAIGRRRFNSLGSRTLNRTRQRRPSHAALAAGETGIGEGQGPRRPRAERAQAKPSTRARTEQAGGGQQGNNKGNPVKQYEPYFSATSAFESEAEIVQTGVTPILRYDSLDRLVRTDFPDGTFTKVEFDSWKQENWDQNDTVLESTWYGDRGSPPVTDPEPSAPEARAAWLAAQHANTPTVSHLDTLGRPFLSVAHNRTNGIDELYQTRTKLDVEGNTLAIFDARQIARAESTNTDPLPTIEQTFDVLQRRLKVVSADAGTVAEPRFPSKSEQPERDVVAVGLFSETARNRSGRRIGLGLFLSA